MTDHGTDLGYVRISRDVESSGSLGKQRASILRAAPEARLYEDASISGGVPFAERPAGAKVLRALKPGDRLVATKLDRISRNVADLLELVRVIEAKGASVKFTEQDIDTSGPMGRFLLTLLGAVAELERETVGERRRESIAAAKEEGRWFLGTPPYGLRSVPAGNGQRGLVLRPHPEQAPALREAISDLLEGRATQRSISERLGILQTRLARILRNPRIAGVVNPDDAEPRVDPEQAVIDLETWQRLQDFIRERPSRGRPVAVPNYGAALECSGCGGMLYRRVTRRGKRVYESLACDTTRPLRRDATGHVAVSMPAAHEHLEHSALALVGHLPVWTEKVVESSEARREAIARARLAVDQAKAAMDDADEDGEDAAVDAWRKAKRHLRAAENLPDTTTYDTYPTGQSVTDWWRGQGHDNRLRLLQALGPWTVAPGRGAVTERVTRAGEPLAGIGAVVVSRVPVPAPLHRPQSATMTINTDNGRLRALVIH